MQHLLIKGGKYLRDHFNFIQQENTVTGFLQKSQKQTKQNKNKNVLADTKFVKFLYLSNCNFSLNIKQGNKDINLDNSIMLFWFIQDTRQTMFYIIQVKKIYNFQVFAAQGKYLVPPAINTLSGTQNTGECCCVVHNVGS